ncbi:MAG: type II toxin-antitoxin system RelE/ParE family toxin [Rhizomicrobium sp.]
MTKAFGRFAADERLSDAVLSEAVARAQSGLINADLGGGVIKQRIARSGAGKSGGYRTIIAFRKGTLAILIYGFAKKRT